MEMSNMSTTTTTNTNINGTSIGNKSTTGTGTIVTRANSNLLPLPPPSTTQAIASIQKNYDALRSQVCDMETKFDTFKIFMVMYFI